MSGCANPRCRMYGHDHAGVGQTPEHPVDINPWPILLAVIIPVALLIILSLLFD